MKIQHESFSSLEEMLLPRNLTNLLGRQVNTVEITPILEHTGFSGASLFNVKLNGENGLFLKEITDDADWFAVTTHDTNCRSVTIYEYGVLDLLLPTIQHVILACAVEKKKRSILMKDVSAGIVPFRTPLTKSQVEIALSALATMHATFWDSHELKDVALGLCSATDLVGCMSIAVVQQNSHLTGPLPTMVSRGWEVLKEELESDAFNALETLIYSPEALTAAFANYPSSLVHGDYRASNFSYLSDSAIALFDWQMASFGLPSIDLCWFLDSPEFNRSTYEFESASSFYLQCINRKLKEPIGQEQWNAMLDLGQLANTIRMAVFTAYFARYNDIESEKVRLQADLPSYNTLIRAGLGRL